MLIVLSLSPSLQAQSVANAPVAPETIYVGRLGAQSGVSVIDLNGFGCSTGNPMHDPSGQVFMEGWSNYANNPNLIQNGIQLGLPTPTSTLNGGSSGVFSLTRNSDLNDRLLEDLDVGDMMIGHALDSVMNNSAPPFGCQSGGGNLCAAGAFKDTRVVVGGPNTVKPSFDSSLAPIGTQFGPNPISFAPSPNPPPLSPVPLCAVPEIGGQEPIGRDAPVQNLLLPGDPFGDPLNGIPPMGLLSPEQNAFFVGPSKNQVSATSCSSYAMRQNVGHFLYVIDRTHSEIVVVNSNSFQVIDRIVTSDPTELAMSPTLGFLAVTNRSDGTVAFIDISPSSTNFHQVVKVTKVGESPSGIAWDSGNEDIFVCNTGSNDVSIISAFSFDVRKTIGRGLDAPFAVALTQRQSGFGFDRNVYFAYVLDRAGAVTLFESGPSGVNGWGFDQFIGKTKFRFNKPTAIQPDPLNLSGGVWITHSGQLDRSGSPTALTGGAVTNLALTSTTTGQIALQPGERANLRGLDFKIVRSIGSDQLTGAPLDLAFDNLRNLGALPGLPTAFTPSVAQSNGKGQVRSFDGTIANANEASYLFVPVASPSTAGSHAPGKTIDVIELATGKRIDTNAFQPGIQSIPADGARVVADYFRQ